MADTQAALPAVAQQLAEQASAAVQPVAARTSAAAVVVDVVAAAAVAVVAAADTGNLNQGLTESHLPRTCGGWDF